MTSVVYFFGYGVYRNPERVREILQKKPRGGYGAMAENFDLAIQNINQTPEKIKEILEKAWGNGFKAYTLKPGKGVVAGVIWELEEKDLRILFEWDFIGQWRNFEIIKIKRFDGVIVEAIVEKVPDNDPTDQVVDGINYVDILNSTRPRQKIYQRTKEDEECEKKEIIRIMSELQKISP